MYNEQFYFFYLRIIFANLYGLLLKQIQYIILYYNTIL